MYCPFCGHELVCAFTFCGMCGKNVKFLNEVEKCTTSEESTEKSVLSTVQAVKKKERKSFSKKKEKPLGKKLVKISVGIMTMTDGELKPVRGMVLPLAVHPEVDAEQLRKTAEQKMRDFNKDLQSGPHFLLYPDGTKIVNIPGTDTPFTLQAYREATRKAYQRITVYICSIEDFYPEDVSTGSSDSEAALSDSEDAPGTSRGTMDTACYRNTELNASIKIKDEEDLGSDGDGHDIANNAQYKRKRRRDEPPRRCPDNGHQSTPTSISPRRSVNPFGFYKADLQLPPVDKENVTVKEEEEESPIRHQENPKPPHIAMKDEPDPDLYSASLTDDRTEDSSETDDSEDWK